MPTELLEWGPAHLRDHDTDEAPDLDVEPQERPDDN